MARYLIEYPLLQMKNLRRYCFQIETATRGVLEKKCVLKNLAKFTEKSLCRSLPECAGLQLSLNKTADLVTLTEEILNGKLHFLCSVY